jgi:hypothetical protein
MQIKVQIFSEHKLKSVSLIQETRGTAKQHPNHLKIKYLRSLTSWQAGSKTESSTK